MNFNQARLSIASVIRPADHPWLGWAGCVQPPVYNNNPSQLVDLWHNMMVRGTRKGEVDKTASSQDYITTVSLWNQLSQHTIVIKIPKSTCSYFNPNTFLWISFLQKYYFATCKLIWCINVKWIHKQLSIEIKAVILYIKQYSSKQGTVSLNRKLQT